MSCYECFFYLDDGGELFGTNPNCIHPDKPGNMDKIMDGDCNCSGFMEWENRICTDCRHSLMEGIWTICPDCGTHF